jgi:hypothetical protein
MTMRFTHKITIGLALICLVSHTSQGQSDPVAGGEERVGYPSLDPSGADDAVPRSADLVLPIEVRAVAEDVIVVTTLEDDVDFGGAQEVDDLPGPDGAVSFREAVIAANNTLGPQTITFNIPQDEWWLYADRAILRLENGLFHITDDDTTVDFTTQTDFTGDTNPDGNEVGIYGLEPNGWGVTAILVSADNCTIIGLDRVMQRGHGVQLRGHNNRVIGCTISGPLYSGVYITGGYESPPATGNLVGGTEPGEGNRLSAGNDGVRIDAPADENVVIGNVLTGSFHGASVRGSIYTTRPANNRVGGPTAEERNIISDAGHYGEEGFPDGAQVNIEYADGTIVEGNYIGTTADGGASSGQIGPVGVRLLNSNDTIVRDNLISGIAVDGTFHYAGQRFGEGISIVGSCDNTQILGNRIGTDASGENEIPNRTGITLGNWPGDGSPTDTQIGGQTEGEDNIIAFNELDGVSVGGTVSGVTVSGNAIDLNGELGIDLAPGANGDQAAPSLTAAATTADSVTIEGTLSSAPNADFVVEFFAGAACDPSGFGEGAVFLGSTEVQTDGSGEATFEETLPVAVTPGWVITATATAQISGNTSEFSACVEAAAAASPADIDGDGDVDLEDTGFFISCITGPDNGPVAEGCEPADLDSDGDADLLDWVEFQELYQPAS